MRSLAILIALASFGSTAYPDEPATPPELIGRWKMHSALHLGKEQSTDDIQVEIEFTKTQYHLYMWQKSKERPEQPEYIGDCYARSAKGLLMLDLKTSKDNPGPEKDLEVLCIYKLIGNELTICHGSSDDPRNKSPRPTDFVSTPESNSDLDVLTRVSSK